MYRMLTQGALLYTAQGMSKDASSVVARGLPGIGFEMKSLDL